LKWLLDPLFLLCCLLAGSVIYILSLGPVLCLCQLSAGWDGWPHWVHRVYAPLHSWVKPEFDTAYGQYLLWWINLQYWQHW
jgi:hypothetical protein